VSAILKRETFETSRALEYFTEKELTAQIGFNPEYWPVAILRELIDNALDACESGGVLPSIEITTSNDTISVTDNGPGMPASTIEKSLDYLIRVSNKAYYVSPTRGQMGNALKVIWAAPFVATGKGRIEIEAHGERHRVEISLDRIAQRPNIAHDVAARIVKPGTAVTIAWTDSTRLLREPEADSYNAVPTAAELVAGFAAFNPHATFVLDARRFERTMDEWKKWAPDLPTSAHWYSAETLRDLIAAYIARERDGGPERTVREFVSEFRGLSGTAKQKTVTEGWSGKRLHEFVVDGDVDDAFVAELLARMQSESSAPPAKALGSIGKEHLTAWMASQGVAAESVRYQQKTGIDGLPFVLEIAFGINNNDESTRRIVTGLNWSPVIGGDPDPTLRSVISEARLDRHDPVTLVVHIARPRFQFADRGKTRVML
jgi:DNA topoisomerase VI subunit B